MPIRLLVLGDASAVLSESIRSLPAAFDIDVIGVHSDAASSQRALESLRPDVAVVCADMVDGAGFDVLSAVSADARSSALVFVSPREEDAVRAFELQATDFVSLPLQGDRLRDAMVRARQQVLQSALLRTADELQRLLGEVVTVETLRGSSSGRTFAMADAAALAVQRVAQDRHRDRHADRDNGRTGSPAWRAGVGEAFAAAGAGVAAGAAHGAAHGAESWRASAGQRSNGRSSALSGGLATRVVRDTDDAVLDLSASPADVAVAQAAMTDGSDGRPLRVLVREGRRTRFVPLGDIDWFEADGNYIVVHAGAQTYRTRGTITAIEAVLDPRQFVRIHRRVVVNMDRVRELTPLPGGDGMLLLGSGATLRLSRTYRARIR